MAITMSRFWYDEISQIFMQSQAVFGFHIVLTERFFHEFDSQKRHPYDIFDSSCV